MLFLKKKKDRYGTIRHTGITDLKENKNTAELEVTMDWLAPDGKVLLKEKTRFVFFSEGKKTRYRPNYDLDSPGRVSIHEGQQRGRICYSCG